MSIEQISDSRICSMQWGPSDHNHVIGDPSKKLVILRIIALTATVLSFTATIFTASPVAFLATVSFGLLAIGLFAIGNDSQQLAVYAILNMIAAAANQLFRTIIVRPTVVIMQNNWGYTNPYDNVIPWIDPFVREPVGGRGWGY